MLSEFKHLKPLADVVESEKDLQIRRLPRFVDYLDPGDISATREGLWNSINSYPLDIFL